MFLKLNCPSCKNHIRLVALRFAQGSLEALVRPFALSHPNMPLKSNLKALAVNVVRGLANLAQPVKPLIRNVLVGGLLFFACYLVSYLTAFFVLSALR